MKQYIESKKPVIGISANLLVMEGESISGLERTYVNHDYITAILRAKAVPILLPVIADFESIRKQMELIDGLLLSGGSDVSPLLYGEEPYERLEFVYLERDECEIQLIKIAQELGKPILGICRGLQILNVAFGGTLYQDITQCEPKTTIQHSQNTRIYQPSHTVDLVEGTKLQQIFGKPSILTNSFHHQALKKLGAGFKISAFAKDGVVEGIEQVDSSFIVGVQWHPERMVEKYPEMLKLFEAFISKAKGS